MPKTLDRSRDFGEMIGFENAAFIQDEVLFDCNGNEIVSEQEAHKKPGRPKKAVVEDQIATNLTEITGADA